MAKAKSTKQAKPKTLTVLVPEEVTEYNDAGSLGEPTTSLPIEGETWDADRLNAIEVFKIGPTLKRVFGFKEVTLPAGKLEQGVRAVAGQVNGMLSEIPISPAGGYALKEVQVGVGISLDGNFAVVSAGVQASLTLIYSRQS